MSDQTGSAASADRAGNEVHELSRFGRHWWWFLLLGIGLMVLGLIAIGSGIGTQFAVTVITMKVFGVLLLIAGAELIIVSFWTGQWSGFLVHLLVGVLYVVVGLLVIDSPVETAEVFTLLMAAFFIVSGIFRVIAALVMRFHHWGWVLLNGMVSLVLGILIAEGWPSTGLFVIGLFVGIELLFNGLSWIATAVALRQARDLVSAGD